MVVHASNLSTEATGGKTIVPDHWAKQRTLFQKVELRNIRKRPNGSLKGGRPHPIELGFFLRRYNSVHTLSLLPSLTLYVCNACVPLCTYGGQKPDSPSSLPGHVESGAGLLACSMCVYLLSHSQTILFSLDACALRTEP